MADFFETQKDYIYFLYGLSFILLGTVSLVMMKKRKQGPDWLWLGLFGIIRGIHEWLDILRPDFSQISPLSAIATATGVSSFLFLLEFGRLGFSRIRGKTVGLWIYFPLVMINLLGASAGAQGLLTASIYSTGLIGGIWTVYVLIREGRMGGNYAMAGWAFGVFLLTSVLAPSYVPFPPASFLNSGLFLKTFGFPVQLLRIAAITVCCISLWLNSESAAYAKLGGLRNKRRTYAPVAIMLLISAAGWTFTDAAGEYAVQEELSIGRDFIEILAADIRGKLSEARKTTAVGDGRDLSSVAESGLIRIKEDLVICRDCFISSPDGKIFLSGNDNLEGLQVKIRDGFDSGAGSSAPKIPDSAANAEGATVQIDGRQYAANIRLLNGGGWAVARLCSTSHITTYRLLAIIITGVFSGFSALFIWLIYFTQEHAIKTSLSEQRYKSLVEGSPNCILLFDFEGRCLAVNKTGLDLLGRDEKEIIGSTLDAIWKSDAAENLAEALASVKGGSKYSFETVTVKPDGKRIIWSAILNPVYDPDGEIESFVGIFVDITRRKTAEEGLMRQNIDLETQVFERTAELTELNNRLKMEIADRKQVEEIVGWLNHQNELILKSAGEGIYGIDMDGKITFINPAASRMLGWTAEEMIGRSPHEMMHHTRSDGAPYPVEECRVYESLRSGMEQHENDEVFWNKDGSSFPVEYISAPMMESSRIVGAVVIFKDISERKEAEAELKNHRERLSEMVEERTTELKSAIQLLTQEINFRKKIEETLKSSESKFRNLSQEFNTLLDAIPDLLRLIGPDFKILWANKAAAAAIGSGVPDMTGKACHELWFNLREPCPNCYAAECFRTGKPEGGQMTYGGGRLFEVRAFPLKDERGEVKSVMMISADITEKTSLQAEAMRASHLASLGELSAGVAHEINNPITGIINYAQILASRGIKGSREQDIAYRIIKEGERIAGIVRSLLSFARERRTAREHISVSRILAETLTLTEAQTRKDGIKLIIDMPSDLPEIVVNPQQIQQVFLNIISNARYALNIKYPKANDEKRLEISGEKISDGEAASVRMVFHDRGLGIPADIMEKVKNPFFTTKPSGEGTGLGLSISHGIIIDHGGKLSIESVEGAYTKVIIELPAKENHATQ